MSKKRFSEGINLMFEEQHHSYEPATQEEYSHGETSASARAQKHSHKNFITNLDSLFEEAFASDVFNELDKEEQFSNNSGKSKTKQATGHRAPVIGLDALIRQTLNHEDLQDIESTKKRLTVTLDKAQLEKMKLIARMENQYLKDVMVKLVDEYIKEFTAEKGIEL